MEITYINNQVEVYAYGEINPWEVCNSDFVRAIKLATEKKCKMVIYVHCFGGSTIEGNMIYNTLLNTKIEKDLVILGICASMATIMMLASDKIRIADNAFLMLHRPTGFVEGDAETLETTAKLLKSISENMAKRYSEMSGKTIAQVNDLWLNGKDNWLSAQEALESGLVHEIINNTVVSEKIDKIEMQANAKGIFKRISASLKPNINTEPMKKILIASLNLEGVNESSTEAEILEAIKKQRSAQDLKIQELEEKAEKDTEKTIDELLDAAVTAKTLDIAQKATYKEVGKTMGLDKMKAMLPVKAAAAVPVNLAGLIKTDATSAVTDDESFDYLQRHAPEKLREIHKTDPKLYAQLCADYAKGKRHITK